VKRGVGPVTVTAEGRKDMHRCSEHGKTQDAISELKTKCALLELELKHVDLQLKEMTTTLARVLDRVTNLVDQLEKVRQGQEITKRWLILAGTVCTVAGGAMGSITTAVLTNLDKIQAFLN
jgi:septal ring factor EnvC (AmiA/AmiB activator)